MRKLNEISKVLKIQKRIVSAEIMYIEVPRPLLGFWDLEETAF